jgi:hypothetical protein
MVVVEAVELETTTQPQLHKLTAATEDYMVAQVAEV